MSLDSLYLTRGGGWGVPQFHLFSLPHKRENGTLNGIPLPQFHFEGGGDKHSQRRFLALEETCARLIDPLLGGGSEQETDSSVAWKPRPVPLRRGKNATTTKHWFKINR